ncbi:MAG: AraC family transcriptional regulator, partial [Coprobacillus sp.]
EGSHEFEKDEDFLLLITLLIQRYGQPFEKCLLEYSQEIEDVCCFIDEHYREHISLQQLCQCVGLSQSTLLRAFTKSKGVTPYRYLESKRINEAKKLLEKGLMPVDVALQIGYSDQSHFTNYFSHITGISPGLYRDIFMKGDS